MIFGGAPLGSVPVGSVLQDPGAITDPQAAQPFTLEINGVEHHDWFDPENLSGNDTLGQSMTTEFILVNPASRPKPGDRVRLLYYSAVLFAGLIDRVELTGNTKHTWMGYSCTCKDWSVLLTRRRLRRNFTNLPVVNIVDSILDNELAGDGLSIGTIDQGATIPLVDVKNAKVFDVLRDVAGATGQAMYVDFNKAIQFRSTTNDSAPKVIDNSVVEAASMVDGLETYRNVQTVVVTGTPIGDEQPNVVIITRQNDEQIAARQAIEGGTGRYEDIEEVTHPTSNAGADLALLGTGYARLRLATSGVPPKTLRVRLRGYDFRAGQFAPVDLPAEGATGTWLIQRARFQTQFGRHLIFNLELTQSSQQQRAYEAWLAIVKAGKVVVQLPGAITNNLQTFNVPGSTTFIVPVGVTVLEITTKGGSGGQGGTNSYGNICQYAVLGGNGGPSGLGITSLDVTPGEVLSIVVGAAGLKGNNGTFRTGAGFCSAFAYSTAGTAGTASRVSRGATVVCQGDGGGGGDPANPVFPPSNGADGAPGSGIGDAVTVGGGVVCVWSPVPHDPNDGNDGIVEIRW